MTPFEKAYKTNTVQIWEDYIRLGKEARNDSDVAWGYYGLGRKQVETGNYESGQRNLRHARSLFDGMPKDEDRDDGEHGEKSPAIGGEIFGRHLRTRITAGDGVIF